MSGIVEHYLNLVFLLKISKQSIIEELISVVICVLCVIRIRLNSISLNQMLRYVENVGGFGFDNKFVNTALEA